MATKAQGLRVISPSDLDDVLDEARAEGWRELALLGPPAGHRASVPEERTSVPEERAFKMFEPLGAQLARLAALSQLTSLDLSGNQIGADGARALAALSQLTSLDLSGNQIGADGARALLDALSEPSRSARLDTLDLTTNRIESSLVPADVLSSRKLRGILAAYRRYQFLEGVRDDRDLYESAGPPAPKIQPSRSPYHGRIDFGIVTIREDENDAVLRRFDKHAVDGQKRRYRIRRLELPQGDAYMLAVLRTLEQGNTDSLMATRDLLDDLSPRFVLVVGIAGGVPSSEFSLGDVVISSRIVDTSVEAVKRDGSRAYALTGGPLSPEAAGIAADISAMISDKELDGWNTDAALGRARPPVDLAPTKFYGSKTSKAKLRTELERHFGGAFRPPLAVTGAISSSDRLVKDTAILTRWQELARQVIAVEMECAGVYKATQGRANFLAIRGISDVVGYERHPDWTAYACETAAAFTRAFLLARPIAPIAVSSRSDESARHRGP